jgi:hypothetical protein
MRLRGKNNGSQTFLDLKKYLKQIFSFLLCKVFVAAIKPTALRIKTGFIL